MATPKRSKGEREQDLILIASLYLRRETHRAIAEKVSAGRDYSISPKQVGYDIGTLLTRWRAEQQESITEAKALELQRLNELEAAAWRQFERSCKPSLKHLKETRDGDNAHTREQHTTEHRAGDPRYLQIVQSCITARCRILGIGESDFLERIVAMEEKIAALEVRP